MVAASRPSLSPRSKLSADSFPGPHAMMPSAIAAQVICIGQPSGTVNSTIKVMRSSPVAANRVPRPSTSNSGKMISPQPDAKAMLFGAGTQCGLAGILELSERGKASWVIGSLSVSAVLRKQELQQLLRLALAPILSGEEKVHSCKNLISGAVRAIVDEDKREEILRSVAGARRGRRAAVCSRALRQEHLEAGGYPWRGFPDQILE